MRLIATILSIYCVFVGVLGLIVWCSYDDKQSTVLAAIGLVVCAPIGLFGLITLGMVIGGII